MLSLFDLTLAFSVISDILETCKWMLNLKETFPFLTRAAEKKKKKRVFQMTPDIHGYASESGMFILAWTESLLRFYELSWLDSSLTIIEV